MTVEQSELRDASFSTMAKKMAIFRLFFFHTMPPLSYARLMMLLSTAFDIADAMFHAVFHALTSLLILSPPCHYFRHAYYAFFFAIICALRHTLIIFAAATPLPLIAAAIFFAMIRRHYFHITPLMIILRH